MRPKSNAVRRDAAPGECNWDLRHGLLVLGPPVTGNYNGDTAPDVMR